MKHCFKKLKLALFVLNLLIWVLPLTLEAVPAYPFPIPFKQLDGSIVNIQLKGDEKVNWGETTDGYKLLNNGKKGWEYATLNGDGDLSTSGILAREVGKRTTKELTLLKKVSKDIHFSQKQIQKKVSGEVISTSSNGVMRVAKALNGLTTDVSNKASKVFTPQGEKKLLMILIQYKDVKFTKTVADFNNLMNTENYAGNGASGSVKDLFKEMSYGKFNITTDVVGIYTATENMAYYGANDASGNDLHANELMAEAVLRADESGVDFSQYDNDGDGTVDGVYVVYAGKGEATSGIAETIWPHASSISPALTVDGKIVAKYSCSNELNNDNTLTTIGVICHEFGHVCGAPDYYDTDYETGGQFLGTSNWDLMCVGVYNKTVGGTSGNKPAPFNPFEKVRAGWVTPITLDKATKLSIPDITTNPVVYIYKSAVDNEYFMMENRQQNGFNVGCPGHGLLVYHFSKSYWDASANKTCPQGFYPICASATTQPTLTSDVASYGAIGSTGCPFPGTSLKTSFDDLTTPSSLSWSLAPTNSRLYGITETSGVISLNFKAEPTVNPILTFNAIPANSSQINLAWNKNAENNDVVVAVNSTATFGTLTYSAGHVLTGGGTIIYSGPASSFNNTGLTPSTTYYYNIWAVNGDHTYSEATACSAKTTLPSVTTFPLFEGFESGIPANWTQEYVSGTTSWTNVTSGINGHPSSAHSGSKIARINVLNFHTDITKLVSPPLDLSGTTEPILKFWHTQESWDSRQDLLRVYYRTSATGEWTQLGTIYQNSIATWTLETLVLPNPSSTYYIAFEGITGTGYGVCLDDVELWSNNCSTDIWTGGSSTSWFDAANWTCGAPPTASTDVSIPSGKPLYPVVIGTTAACKNLTIGNGATLTMDGSTASTLNVFGNWVNNGSFTQGLSTIAFTETSAIQTISGTSKTTFHLIQLKKGLQSNILEATSSIGFDGAIGFYSPIDFVSGTFKLSNPSIIGINTYIPSACGLWNNGGTIDLATSSVYLEGLFRNSSGTTNFKQLYAYSTVCKFQIDGGTVNLSTCFKPYNNNTTYTPTYIQSGGILNLGSSSSDNRFTINNVGSTFTMSGGEIKILAPCTGNADFSNIAGTYNVTGGTLQIGTSSTTGNPNMRINSTVPLYDLNIHGTSTATLTSNDLTVFNDVTVNSGTALVANGQNLTLGGDWANSGSFTPGIGTVTFNGALEQFLSGSSTTTFNNLAIASSSSLNASNSVFSVAGALTNNGTFVPGTGTVTLNGSTAQNLPDGASTPFKNLTIDNAAGVTYSGTTPVTVSGTLQINSGKLLKVAAGSQISTNVINNLAGANGLVLQSGALGSATLLNTGATASVSASVDQLLGSEQNWYVSSPVSNATSLVVNPGTNNKLAYYNEAANPPTYVQIVDNTTALLKGQGFVVYSKAAETYHFTGILNDGDITIHPTRTGTSAAKRGFNLVGNPYPSFLDWEAVGKTNVRPIIWYRTRSTGGSMVFDTYSGGVGTSNGLNGMVTEYIPPMQAFWVKVNADGDVGTLLFNNGMRSHKNQLLASNRLRSASNSFAEKSIIRLRITNGVNSDEAIFVANDGASDGIDVWDAPKMSNENVHVPEIFSLQNGEELSINFQNNFNQGKVFSLGFRTGEVGTFRISSTEMSALDAGTEVVLIDKKLEHEQVLTVDTSYSFTSDATTSTNRFLLLFRNSSFLTALNSQASDEIVKVSQTPDKRISILNTSRISGLMDVAVYNSIGQLVCEQHTQNTYFVTERSFESGIFVVVLRNGSTKISKKIVIN